MTIDISFKNKVTNKPIKNTFCNGNDRKLGIYHSQIRMECSNLRSHLYNLHVVDDPFCEFCKNIVENSEHYFFHCPMYELERFELFRKINYFDKEKIKLENLMYGYELLSKKDNFRIVKLIEQYIYNTGRFY